MVTRREIQPDSVPKPVAEYAQGVEVHCGRLLFVAGQVPTDVEGRLIGEGDIRAQARQVFRNIQAIVEDAGGSMTDIVRLGVFLTDMGDLEGFKEVRREFIKPPFPAATLVAVSALVSPEWLVEVEAIAVIG